MNVKEALLFLKNQISTANKTRAEGFLTCHEMYKPLVGALESISKNSCCTSCQEAKLVADKALDHYRKEILGEEKWIKDK